MNRTNKSTRTSKVDEATIEETRVEFNYNLENGETLPRMVNATAFIIGGGMINVSATSKDEVTAGENVKVLASMPNTSYSNGAKGSTHGALADAIEEECKVILGINN